VIVGASFDTQSDNAAFAQKFGFPFLLLCDTDRSLGMAYGVLSNTALMAIGLPPAHASAPQAADRRVPAVGRRDAVATGRRAPEAVIAS
jgi:hypothetical protein